MLGQDVEGGRFVPGSASLTYVRGTFVCHEWAGYVTFVPDPHGLHRMALDVINQHEWLQWLEETLLSGLETRNSTSIATVAN